MMAFLVNAILAVAADVAVAVAGVSAWLACAVLVTLGRVAIRTITPRENSNSEGFSR